MGNKASKRVLACSVVVAIADQNNFVLLLKSVIVNVLKHIKPHNLNA